VKKTRRILGKKIVAIAFAIGLLGGGTALGQVFPGCNFCSLFGCRSVNDGQYGNVQCTMSWSLNTGNFGPVCTPAGEVCLKASTSITVFGGALDENGNPIPSFQPCSLWDWLTGSC
jgi:hypothetical protein